MSESAGHRADVDAEGDVEAPVVGQLGKREDVPAAAGHVELAVDGLAVVAEQQKPDLHRDLRIGSTEALRLAAAPLRPRVSDAELRADVLPAFAGMAEIEVAAAAEDAIAQMADNTHVAALRGLARYAVSREH